MCVSFASKTQRQHDRQAGWI